MYRIDQERLEKCPWKTDGKIEKCNGCSSLVISFGDYYCKLELGIEGEKEGNLIMKDKDLVAKKYPITPERARICPKNVKKTEVGCYGCAYKYRDTCSICLTPVDDVLIEEEDLCITPTNRDCRKCNFGVEDPHRHVFNCTIKRTLEEEKLRLMDKEVTMKDSQKAITDVMKELIPEQVNHPSHYNNYPMEVIDMMENIWGTEEVITFCEMNAFKYRMRMGLKDNNSIEQDLAKEKWYLNKSNELKNSRA